MVQKIIRENSGRMKAGQDLVVAGFAGWAGTWRIIAAKRRELEQWFAPCYLDGMAGDVPPEGQMPGSIWTRKDWEAFGASDWEPAGAGGILAAIWNLLGAYGLGAEFSLRQIPIKQGTIEICENLGLNPYRLYSQGCHLLASENGGKMVRYLAGRGITAKVIGEITSNIAKVNTDGGGQSFLNRPEPDELERI